eukprot:5439751-Pyramimonas_sp.AAC.1
MGRRSASVDFKMGSERHAEMGSGDLIDGYRVTGNRALRGPISASGAGRWVAPHLCDLRPIFLELRASGKRY